MIKVNLLEGTAEQRVALQKTRVAARRGQQIFMIMAAIAIAVIALLIDHVWTNNAYASAKADYDKEQVISERLKASENRKKELDSELKQVEERIKVIKQLRDQQSGPVPLLSAINQRLPGGNVQFELQSIVEKGSHLTIIGAATSQQVVADFLHQLEFSDGTFTGVTIDLEGQDLNRPQDVNQQQTQGSKPGGKNATDDDMSHMFKFTIDCDYSKPGSADASAPGKPAATQTR